MSRRGRRWPLPVVAQARADHRGGLFAATIGTAIVAVPFAACLSVAYGFWRSVVIAIPVSLVVGAIRLHLTGLPAWPRRRSLGLTDGEMTLVVLTAIVSVVTVARSGGGVCSQLFAAAVAFGVVFLGARIHNTGLMVTAEARHELRQHGATLPSWPPANRNER